MTQLEQVMHTATAHSTRGRDRASRSDRRSFLAISAAAGAFVLAIATLSSPITHLDTENHSRKE